MPVPAMLVSMEMPMKRKRTLFMAGFALAGPMVLFVAAGLAWEPAAPAQTAEEIVAKALEARGGLARVKAVQTERISGSISFGAEASGPFVVELAGPAKMHMELTPPAGKIVRVYDGHGYGWVINPFDENKGVQAMTAEDIQNIGEESDFNGPFVDYKQKGNTVEYTGKESVDGKPAYGLKLTMKNGTVRNYEVDASSYLLLKWKGTRRQDDKDVPVESTFKDYRDVNGMKFAFEIDSGAPGGPPMQKIVVEKIEIDPKIEGSRFGKPAEPEQSSVPVGHSDHREIATSAGRGGRDPRWNK